jgi:hypothetical protein
MKPKVYLETTIVSYLTAWLSRELTMAANQNTTREWWSTYREDYELVISELVIQEASAGDPDAAQRRLDALRGIRELILSDDVRVLARALLADVPLPTKAQADAVHIALAAVNGINYLLTWNCTHIANAAYRERIDAICRGFGYAPPVICTPQELMEGP